MTSETENTPTTPTTPLTPEELEELLRWEEEEANRYACDEHRRW